MSESTAFQTRVSRALADGRVIHAVRLATLHKVDSRAAALRQLRDPEALRERAARIKQHTLDHLPDYLEQFVANVERNGGCVHFAKDAEAARKIVCEIAARSKDGGRGRSASGVAPPAERAAILAVKSKSMTTEEIHLNDALESASVRVVETDLGEFIVQLDRDTPSHIVTPIIHKDRRQIAVTMQRELGCEYTEDPEQLTKIARRHLREIFRRCDVGITGVNFAVAETGTICICTNEGNGRLTATRPRVHIALMGIEKLVPKMRDLPAFLKLLARSATGQPLTVYTTLITGPKRPEDLDGPEELHVVLMDNGRSDILCGPFAEVLRCIRCGACLNACPVYRSVGGHAYGSVYPGPIGSLVTPLLHGLREHHELPRASSLCGACQTACPVKIDIPRFLVMLREQGRGRQPWFKRAGLWAWKWAVRSPWLYAGAQRLLRWVLRFRAEKDGWTRRGPGPLGLWTSCRDLPPPPARSFRRRWEEELKNEH